MRQLPTGTVTLLFADIEGSTRLLHDLGEQCAEVLAEHRRVLRDVFARHGGIEVDTQGDAFLVAFARASDAIAAAGDVQDTLADGPVRVRIGIHTGEPVVTEEGYIGVDVHRAARVMGAGHGGQVLLSETTQRLVGSGAELRDLGEHRLKDVSAPQRLYQLGEGDFPPLKTLHEADLPISPTPLLAAAEEARQQADWERARDNYLKLLEEDPDDPAALDGLGMISWWRTGEQREGIEYRRRAYAEFRRRGDRCRAAGIAVAIAEASRIDGNEAAANGWLARGERLLAGIEECSERGWLEVERAKRAVSPEERELHAREAAEIARRLDDSDLEVSALGQLGLARTLMGEIEEGMTILDEAMAAATGGEASDPLAIGDVCCSTLVACDQLADFRRAADWCRVVVEFTRRRNYTPLSAWCRTIYAGVLTTTGDWQLAEEELREALTTYERLGCASRVFALARLAELRIQQGRLEEAERLLEGYDDHPLALAPAVALDLARGRVALAAERVEARLAAVSDESPAAAPLLPLLADVRIAEGDLNGARDAADRLRELGRTLRREHLIAAAELAAARVSEATCDGAAAAHLQEALDLFAHFDMPRDEARARLELARHHAARGSELAVPEARAALSVFERLGAARDADAAAKLLRSLGAAGRTAERGASELTKRELEVLDLVGAGLSNAEIAERLYITPKTAEHHVGRVLSKLGLRNRTEAAAYLLRERAAKL